MYNYMKRILVTGSQRSLLPQMAEMLQHPDREVLSAFDSAAAMRLLKLLPFDLVVQSGGFGETTDRWLMQTAHANHHAVQWLRHIGPLEELPMLVQQALMRTKNAQEKDNQTPT